MSLANMVVCVWCIFVTMSIKSDQSSPRYITSPNDQKHPQTSSSIPVWFSAERNTIKVNGEICHVDLSHSSPNEIFPHSKWLKGGRGGKNEKLRTGRPSAAPTFLRLDKWIVPLSLSFFSIKCLPFALLPCFMIIKTFACQRGLRRRRKEGWKGRLIQFHSRQRYLPSSTDKREREGGRGRAREINNGNKHTIHLGAAADVKNTYRQCKSELLCLLMSLKLLVKKSSCVLS